MLELKLMNECSMNDRFKPRIPIPNRNLAQIRMDIGFLAGIYDYRPTTRILPIVQTNKIINVVLKKFVTNISFWNLKLIESICFQ